MKGRERKITLLQNFLLVFCIKRQKDREGEREREREREREGKKELEILNSK